MAIAAIVSAMVNVILNYVFIPMLGYIAAAYTTLISYLVLASLDYFYMLRICKQHDIDKNLYSIKWLIALFIVFAALAFTAMCLYNYPIIRYAIILCVFVCMFVFKNKLIELFDMIKRT